MTLSSFSLYCINVIVVAFLNPLISLPSSRFPLSFLPILFPPLSSLPSLSVPFLRYLPSPIPPFPLTSLYPSSSLDFPSSSFSSPLPLPPLTQLPVTEKLERSNTAMLSLSFQQVRCRVYIGVANPAE